ALTAWGRVTGHTTFPWVAFLKRMDVNMPQTYWSARPTTPANELNLMNTQFVSNTNAWVAAGDSAAKKPIMPIGQACYFGYGSDVLTGDIAGFCTTAQSTYKYPGVSLWEYNQITKTFVWDEYAAGWTVTGVNEPVLSAGNFQLSQNFPNPFNPSTRITYELPVSSPVTLKVYDVMGKEITTLVNERKDAGTYSAEFTAPHIASGVYFYTITAGEFTATKKLVLMK
ncbi:MAG: T9SS type A sorting domain-containing protein, partial [Bacteroidota bacterium]